MRQFTIPEKRMFTDIEQIKSQTLGDYRHAFERLVSEGRVENLIANALRKHIAGDSAPLRPMIANETQIILYRDDYVLLELRYIMPSGSEAVDLDSSVTLASSDILMTVIGDGEADVALYESSVITDHAVFDQNARVRPINELTLRRGTFIELSGGIHALRFGSVRRGLTLLQIVSNHYLPLAWSFDATDGRALCVAAPNIESGRQDFCLTALRHLDHREAMDEFENIAKRSPYHFVRMSAVRSLLLWDSERGLAAMREVAATDPHPHVREAAAKTVDNILAARRATA